MSARPFVIVTRPEPGASETAGRLRHLGFEPVLCPLTDIAAVRPAVSASDIAGCRAVAVTSANALRHCPDDLLAALKGMPVYAVGAATAAMAGAMGLERVMIADGDADALGRQIIGNSTPGDRIAYLAGRKRTGTLENRLRDGGVDCLLIETYDTNKVSCLTYKDRLISLRGNPAAILFHSGLALEAFQPCVSAPELEHIFENTSLILISGRFEELVPKAFSGAVHVASAPTDAAMLDCLVNLVAN